MNDFKGALGAVLMFTALIVGMYVFFLDIASGRMFFLSFFLAATGLASLCPRTRPMLSGVLHLALMCLAILLGYVLYDPLWSGLSDWDRFVTTMSILVIGMIAGTVGGVRDMRLQFRQLAPPRPDGDFAESWLGLPPAALLTLGVGAVASSVWAAAAQSNLALGPLLGAAFLLPLLFGPGRRQARAVLLTSLAVASLAGFFGYEAIWAPMSMEARLVWPFALLGFVGFGVMFRWTYWWTNRLIALGNEAEGIVTAPR